MRGKSPFARRISAAGLDFPLLSFLVNVPVDRLKNASKGQVTLTSAEDERIERALNHKAIVYTIWKRAVDGVEPLAASASK